MEIRKFRLGDEYAIYDICLRTGAAGQDASELFEDNKLLGHVFAGAYLRFAPQFATVIDEGAVLGYVLGVPDTLEFDARCEAEWWPMLRKRYPDPVSPVSPDEFVMRMIHHPPPAPAIVAEYPAHLHIDLLPQAQGKGYGRILMDQVLSELAEAGAGGVHLGFHPANTGAPAFYTKLGFDELVRSEDAILMGRRL